MCHSGLEKKCCLAELVLFGCCVSLCPMHDKGRSNMSVYIQERRENVDVICAFLLYEEAQDADLCAFVMSGLEEWRVSPTQVKAWDISKTCIYIKLRSQKYDSPVTEIFHIYIYIYICKSDGCVGCISVCMCMCIVFVVCKCILYGCVYWVSCISLRGAPQQEVFL